MLDFVLHYIDWVGMVFVYLGYFRMAKVKVDGWVWSGIGCILLALSGFDTKRYGIAFGELGFIVVTIFGYLTWRKNRYKSSGGV